MTAETSRNNVTNFIHFTGSGCKSQTHGVKTEEESVVILNGRTLEHSKFPVCSRDPEASLPPSLSPPKLASNTLMSFFLHFEACLHFPALVRCPERPPPRKKKKSRWESAREKERERERRGSLDWGTGGEGRRMGGESYCGETAYTWV